MEGLNKEANKTAILDFVLPPASLAAKEAAVCASEELAVPTEPWLAITSSNLHGTEYASVNFRAPPSKHVLNLSEFSLYTRTSEFLMGDLVMLHGPTYSMAPDLIHLTICPVIS